MRITGLASGMDVDDMVKKMMQPYKMRVDKAKQQREVVKWRQDSYREIITDINKLRYTYLDIKGGDKNILRLRAGDVLSAKDKEGNSADIRVVKGTAQNGEYKVDVKQKATAAKVNIKLDKNFTSDIDEEIEISLNGKSPLKIQCKGSTTDEVVKSINDQINSKPELKDLTGKIIARYSEIEGGLLLETKETGEKTSLKVKSNLIKNGIKISDTLDEKGADAEFTVTNPDGVKSKLIKSSTNNYEIDGLNINIISSGETSFNVKQDTDEVFKKVKAFVDDYNKLVDKLSNKTREKKQFNYKALTAEQKKEMGKDDIKLWEEKAKQGLLRDDSDLRSMLNDLRRTFFEDVDGCGIKFGEKLGISTSKDYTKPGQIVLDEDKFKKNLEKNPEEIMNLLFKQADSKHEYTADISKIDSRKERFKQEGIFQRINDVFLDFTRTLSYGSKTKGRLIEKAGMKDEYGSFNEFNNIVSKQLKEKDELIKTLSKKADAKENQLYLKFSRLEKILNNYNSQASWLQAQFGGGQ